MIILGQENPHAFLETSHISVPEKSYAKSKAGMRLTGANMRKASAVYVGGTQVYPERFRYSIMYRQRTNISYFGNYYKEFHGYGEMLNEGYVEDTVRLDTVFPVYYKFQSIANPPDFYRPYNESGEYSEEPWGHKEIHSAYSGTEHLITPAAALHGSIPNHIKYLTDFPPTSEYNGHYKQYTSAETCPILNSTIPKAGYRLIAHRTVKISTSFPENQFYGYEYINNNPGYVNNWPAYLIRDHTTEYSMEGRHSEPVLRTSTNSRDAYSYNLSKSIVGGYYMNDRSFRNFNTLYLSGGFHAGFTYRAFDSVGEPGLFLATDLMYHSGGASGEILLGEDSSNWLAGFLRPGEYYSADSTFSLLAPPFSGHKHIDNYSTVTYRMTDFNKEGVSWETASQWAHTDLDGSFTLLYNNNPQFSSIAEYVQAYFGR